MTVPNDDPSFSQSLLKCETRLAAEQLELARTLVLSEAPTLSWLDSMPNG
jgi:hypothetical protein